MSEPWLTDNEKRANHAESLLSNRWADLDFVDLDMCTDKDKSRHKANLDGRFTAEQLRAIADAMESLATGGGGAPPLGASVARFPHE